MEDLKILRLQKPECFTGRQPGSFYIPEGPGVSHRRALRSKEEREATTNEHGLTQMKPELFYSLERMSPDFLTTRTRRSKDGWEQVISNQFA
jgi:hypothetical protein